MPPLNAGVNNTPTQPRPSMHGGTLASLLLNPRVWEDHEFIVPSDYPALLFKGDNVHTFAFLSALQNGVKQRTAAAVNATASLTAAQVKGGFITSTSVAPVTATLPIATTLGTTFTAARGTEAPIVIDNTAGSSVVTMAVNTGITAVGSLAVAVGSVGYFKLYFKSATTALLIREDDDVIGSAAVVAPLTGTMTGTVDSVMADIVASAGATAGGSAPTATQVDAGIATAVATIVSGTNTNLKELQTTLNAVLVALKNAGLMASS